jgi:hypothetical protein
LEFAMRRQQNIERDRERAREARELAEKIERSRREQLGAGAFIRLHAACAAALFPHPWYTCLSPPMSVPYSLLSPPAEKKAQLELDKANAAAQRGECVRVWLLLPPPTTTTTSPCTSLDPSRGRACACLARLCVCVPPACTEEERQLQLRERYVWMGRVCPTIPTLSTVCLPHSPTLCSLPLPQAATSQRHRAASSAMAGDGECSSHGPRPLLRAPAAYGDENSPPLPPPVSLLPFPPQLTAAAVLVYVFAEDVRGRISGEWCSPAGDGSPDQGAPSGGTSDWGLAWLVGLGNPLSTLGAAVKTVGCRVRPRLPLFLCAHPHPAPRTHAHHTCTAPWAWRSCVLLVCTRAPLRLGRWCWLWLPAPCSPLCP